MNTLTIIIIFLLGLLIGSFLNVVICRIPDIKSIIFARSHCPKCKYKLAWYDLIPLVSFLLLAQKCRHCGKQISWQYPLVELATALVLVVFYYYFGLSLVFYFYSFISLGLVVIFVYDLYHHLILDEIVYPLIVVSLLFHFLQPSLFDLKNVIFGALIATLVILALVLFTRGAGMGIGDIKLVFLLGLLMGWPEVLVGLFFSFIIGSIVGLLLIAYKKKTLKSTIAFGPFLIVGFYITLFWGEKILNWYLR